MDCVCDVGGAGEAECEGETVCLWLVGVGSGIVRFYKFFFLGQRNYLPYETAAGAEFNST